MASFEDTISVAASINWFAFPIPIYKLSQLVFAATVFAFETVTKALNPEE